MSQGSTSGPCETFPAPGLRDPFRYITGHNEKGEPVFLQVSIRFSNPTRRHVDAYCSCDQTDHGDHRDPMLGGAAAQNIMYSSRGNPVELTDNVDVDFAKENKVSLRWELYIPNLH